MSGKTKAKQFITINKKNIVSWPKFFLCTIALISLFNIAIGAVCNPYPKGEGLGTKPGPRVWVSFKIL